MAKRAVVALKIAANVTRATLARQCFQQKLIITYFKHSAQLYIVFLLRLDSIPLVMQACHAVMTTKRDLRRRRPITANEISVSRRRGLRRTLEPLTLSVFTSTPKISLDTYISTFKHLPRREFKKKCASWTVLGQIMVST